MLRRLLRSQHLQRQSFLRARAFGADVRGSDPYQDALMEERCILVNDDDQAIGQASKRVCHQMSEINKGMLHRAFSVFLFNTKGELLLQQRSKTKITFPSLWTNTCCSHPLHIPTEIIEKDQQGVKVAARRKLEHELGIPQASFQLDDFKYLTRIHYIAPSNGPWGEAEVDYILFAQKDLPLQPNPEEVDEVKYVTPAGLKQLLSDASTSPVPLVTPWFRLICNNFLYQWWDQLPDIMARGGLKDAATVNKIHRL